MGVDFWDAAMWKQEMDKYEVRVFHFYQNSFFNYMNLICIIILYLFVSYTHMSYIPSVLVYKKKIAKHTLKEEFKKGVWFL